MRIPNVYVKFETREERIDFLYRLLGIAVDDFKVKQSMQGMITRMEYGTTSSPYYRSYRWKASTAARGNDAWRPTQVHHRGIRRIYFRYKMQHKTAIWLAVQLEDSDRGRRMFLEILEAIPEEQIVLLGKIPSSLYAERLIRQAGKALDDLESDLFPSSETMFQIQTLLTKAKELDASKFSGNRIFLWERLAFQWAGQGKLNRMETCFRHQADLQPGCSDAFLNMGFQYTADGQLRKAEKSYLEGLRRDPTDEFILHNLAGLYKDMHRDRKEILSTINEAILANPSLPSIYKLKADFHAEWDELDAALELYQYALSLCEQGWKDLFQELLNGIEIMNRELARHKFRQNYAGDWKDGLRHGEGREFYENGILKYEGQWMNDAKNGRGTGYWNDGSLWYEGEFVDNNPHGIGRMFYKNGALHYEGEFKQGQLCGKGKEYYANGQIKFIGVFAENPYFFHGCRSFVKGKLYYESGQLWYEGCFQNYSKHAQFSKGIEYAENGEIKKRWDENERSIIQTNAQPQP
ncbi:hypothetical protein [Ferviditalea candida]|uniref:Tetratricopeptide repeat protein n=1 Tax=Ferviditalea candida TaxID=3108399 RepID=A0ABU5ZK53_9BACL|nr:hypothetical protein [Paenibacillaceae bacterium T2]